MKIARKISYGAELQVGLAEGVKKVYEVAVAAYGPSAGNAMIELNFGPPQVSRDGVTNVTKVYLEDPIENMAARTIVQASERSNKKVGDGTTAVVILAFHLYREAMKRISAGHNRMEVSREIQRVANEVIEKIDGLKIDVKDGMLEHVARVSAGDPAIGAMIADTIEQVGIEGGVIVEDFEGIGIYNELVKGIYFRKGFTEQYLTNNIAAAESIVEDADILILEKPMRTAADIAPILEKVVQFRGKGTELVVIGDVDAEALATLAATKHGGNLITTLLDVPYSPMKPLFLEDIAALTGGKVYPLGAKPADFAPEMLGGADKVVVNAYSTTIIGPQGADEDKKTRLADLRSQLKETDSSADIEFIRDRLSKLTGKVAIIRVGGATTVEREEVKLRVEDAIAAVQAAIKDGIVPGGGVTLARLAPDDWREPFEAPFKILVANAGHNAEEALFKVLEQNNPWWGYDLRADFKPIDLLDVGIVDPALVIKEAVQNSASVVSQIITVGVGLTFEDREMKSD